MSDVEAGHLSVGHESLDSASDVFGQRNELDCRQRLGDDVDDIMARVQAAASGQAEGSWAQKTESTVFRILGLMLSDSGPSSRRKTARYNLLRLVLFFVDWLQLCSIMLSPAVGYSFDWGFLSFMSQVSLLRLLGVDASALEAFVIIWCFAVAIMVLALANVAYVGWQVRVGFSGSLLPVRTLRAAVTILLTACYVPLVEIVAEPLSCEQLQQRSPSPQADVPCWGQLHGILFGIGLPVLLLFVGFALLMRSVYFNDAPLSGVVSAKPIARNEFWDTFARTTLVMLSLLLSKSNPMLMTALIGVMYLLLTIQAVMHLPYYMLAMTQLRVATYCALVWLAIGGVTIQGLRATPSVDEEVVALFAEIWVFCMVLALGIGVLVSWLRQRWMERTGVLVAKFHLMEQRAREEATFQGEPADSVASERPHWKKTFPQRGLDAALMANKAATSEERPALARPSEGAPDLVGEHADLRQRAHPGAPGAVPPQQSGAEHPQGEDGASDVDSVAVASEASSWRHGSDNRSPVSDALDGPAPEEAPAPLPHAIRIPATAGLGAGVPRPAALAVPAAPAAFGPRKGLHSARHLGMAAVAIAGSPGRAMLPAHSGVPADMFAAVSRDMVLGSPYSAAATAPAPVSTAEQVTWADGASGPAHRPATSAPALSSAAAESPTTDSSPNPVCMQDNPKPQTPPPSPVASEGPDADHGGSIALQRPRRQPGEKSPTVTESDRDSFAAGPSKSHGPEGVRYPRGPGRRATAMRSGSAIRSQMEPASPAVHRGRRHGSRPKADSTASSGAGQRSSSAAPSRKQPAGSRPRHAHVSAESKTGAAVDGFVAALRAELGHTATLQARKSQSSIKVMSKAKSAARMKAQQAHSRHHASGQSQPADPSPRLATAVPLLHHGHKHQSHHHPRQQDVPASPSTMSPAHSVHEQSAMVSRFSVPAMAAEEAPAARLSKLDDHRGGESPRLALLDKEESKDEEHDPELDELLNSGAHPSSLESHASHVWSSDTDVELFVRALLAKPTARRMVYARALLDEALVVFPESVFVRLSFTTYLFSRTTTYADIILAMKLLAEASSMPASLDLRFAVFSKLNSAINARRRLVLGDGQPGMRQDSLDLVEFKKGVKLADDKHREAISLMLAYWTAVAHGATDGIVMRDKSVTETVTGIIEAADAAEKAFLGLLERWPTSQQVQRAYGIFLINVRNDKDLGDAYLSMGENADDDLAETGMGSSVVSKLAGNKASGAASVGMGSTASGASLISVDNIKRRRTRLGTSETRIAATLGDISRMRNGFRLGLAVLLIIICGMLGISAMLFSDIRLTVSVMSEAGIRRFQAHKALMESRGQRLAAVEGNAEAYAKFQTVNLAQAQRFHALTDSLYFHGPHPPVIAKQWSVASLTSKTWNPNTIPGRLDSSKVGLMAFSSMFIASTARVARMNLTSMAAPWGQSPSMQGFAVEDGDPFYTLPEYRYIIENYRPLLDELDLAASAYQNANVETAETTNAIMFGLTGVRFLVLFLLAWCVVMPAMNSIRSQKLVLRRMVLAIPRKVASHMSARLKTVQKSLGEITASATSLEELDPTSNLYAVLRNTEFLVTLRRSRRKHKDDSMAGSKTDAKSSSARAGPASGKADARLAGGETGAQGGEGTLSSSAAPLLGGKARHADSKAMSPKPDTAPDADAEGPQGAGATTSQASLECTSKGDSQQPHTAVLAQGPQSSHEMWSSSSGNPLQDQTGVGGSLGGEWSHEGGDARSVSSGLSRDRGSSRGSTHDDLINAQDLLEAVHDASEMADLVAKRRGNTPRSGTGRRGLGAEVEREVSDAMDASEAPTYEDDAAGVGARGDRPVFAQHFEGHAATFSSTGTGEGAFFRDGPQQLDEPSTEFRRPVAAGSPVAASAPTVQVVSFADGSKEAKKAAGSPRPFSHTRKPIPAGARTSLSALRRSAGGEEELLPADVAVPGKTCCGRVCPCLAGPARRSTQQGQQLVRAGGLRGGDDDHVDQLGMCTNPSLRRVVARAGAVITCLVALMIATTVVFYAFSAESATKAAQMNSAGRRRYLAIQTVNLLQELMLADNQVDTPENLVKRAEATLDFYERVHNGLELGDEGLGLAAADPKSPEAVLLARLNYGEPGNGFESILTSISGIEDFSGIGLDPLVRFFWSKARQVIETYRNSSAPRPPRTLSGMQSDEDFRAVWDMQHTVIDTMQAKAVGIFSSSNEAVVDSLEAQAYVVLSIEVVMLGAAYVLVYAGISSALVSEHLRAHDIRELIPAMIRINVPGLSDALATAAGKDDREDERV
ncbi:hypothetical protein FNF29_07136 [Cafeteria roenbergensis]|uniref:TmcB/TmcC TPR repeats domain-containing protein n=1 Tax=Cafeteria roenbergensis TaxID=33653 RepID=A0A5A8C7D6_CAFRO|nr:hypothetical protein FNF29_07136 [Cafeteria roenbergensis]|eukprot:KAA0147791.1 hypothetical protein FNF29_07136 [Cafeteria roenbergensis]